MSRPFTIEEHTADIRINVQGDTQAALFTHAADAVWHIMEPTYTTYTLTNAVPISVYASNVTWLLVDFLSELVTYADTHHVAYQYIDIVELHSYRCVANISGHPVDTFAGIEIKGITHHEAQVHHDAHRWYAQIICDI